MTITSPSAGDGTVVAELLDLRWTVHHDRWGLGIDALAGLALRRNPRRAHLVVSKVLAKHIPAEPAAVRAAALLLAALAGERLGAEIDPRLRGALVTDPSLSTEVAELAEGTVPGDPIVVGFCETATGLGHAVAEAFSGASYVSTTRRPSHARGTAALFEEEHSHAVGHHLQPQPGLLRRDAPVVLVDDELTTGTTILNTIEALALGHRTWIVATLMDLRPAAARAVFDARAAALGVDVTVVSLLDGELHLPDDVLERAAPLAARLAGTPDDAPVATAVVVRPDVTWPAHVPTGGRHGFLPADRTAFSAAIARAGDAVLTGLAPDPRVLVIGVEELMHAPVRLAHQLSLALGGGVRVQSTTRSPVLPLDEAGYAIRHRLTFPGPELPPRDSFVYNVGTHGPWTDIVVVAEDQASVDDALLAALRPWATHAVHVAALDPVFGSYDPQEVTWLMTDLSGVDLELGTAEREAAIQGGRSYAEMLPVEFQPDAAYLALFHETLAQSAERIALAVGTVADLILARHPDPVLVSLARAGTPIGILLKRWLLLQHGLDVPHATISIIRGKGIDVVALQHLLDRHAPEQLQLVDGWTGKGAIAREAAAAVAAHPGIDPEIAVLADPGSCTTLFGTREDFLIPSACLNSTVSGLVSRTVLRPDLIGPGMFHGAKSYPELAGHDVSATFLDAVTAAFPLAAERLGAVDLGDRTPTWSGWAAVEAIAAEHGIVDITLVKPGVGETTRVLLRRVPWRVLVRPSRRADVEHVLMLAAARGVEVAEREDLPYSCVGIIRPAPRP